MAFACLFASGCKKRTPPTPPKAPLESVITNRMDDAAYLDDLRKNRAEQTAKAGERALIVAQMEACIARVKGTLPKDADQATLKAALAKDADWVKLEARNAQAIGEIHDVLGKAREKVRQRMLEEAQAVKAVSEGKAKAADPTDGK